MAIFQKMSRLNKPQSQTCEYGIMSSNIVPSRIEKTKNLKSLQLHKSNLLLPPTHEKLHWPRNGLKWNGQWRTGEDLYIHLPKSCFSHHWIKLHIILQYTPRLQHKDQSALRGRHWALMKEDFPAVYNVEGSHLWIMSMFTQNLSNKWGNPWSHRRVMWTLEIPSK